MCVQLFRSFTPHLTRCWVDKPYMFIYTRYTALGNRELVDEMCEMIVIVLEVPTGGKSRSAIH